MSAPAGEVAPTRIGVLRPTALHPVAAEAEARVIRHELERRLGPLVLDLRIGHVEPIGPWQPVAHASWPSSIDALVADDELFGDGAPTLTALFARTVEPEAAAVRRRMLAHLGMHVDGAFDDQALAELDGMFPTPTDLWLIVGAAAEVTVSDAAIAGFAETATSSVESLDAAFDRIAERLRSNDAVGAAVDSTLERTVAERDALRDEVEMLRLQLARERAEFAETLDATAADRAAADLGADLGAGGA